VASELPHLLILDEKAIMSVGGTKNMKPICAWRQIDYLLLKTKREQPIGIYPHHR
jgi:hypothetical protein